MGNYFLIQKKIKFYRTDLQQEILYKQKNSNNKNPQTNQKNPTTEKKTYVER